MARTKKQNHDSAVGQAIEYIREHLHQKLTIPEIAAATGYSTSRLNLLCKQTTGHGLLTHIHSLRIEKAKQLLVQTDLPVTEIALSVGFGGHEQFTRLFHKKAGLSPSDFRDSLRDSNIAPPLKKGLDSLETNGPWLTEKFAGKTLSCGDWSFTGKFSLEQSYSIGEDEESFLARLGRSIPENLEVSLEVQFVRGSGLLPTHLVFAFHNQSGYQSCYSIVLGDHDHHLCMLRDRGLLRRTKLQPPIHPGQWQTVRIRLADDLLTVYLDEQMIFEFQNDFPPRYDLRNQFLFGTWQSRVLFRNLMIRDLGYPTLVRPARQGDSLYNSGAFEPARDFYIRLLESNPSLADSAELQYKIGLCCIGRQSFGQARVWLDRLRSIPSSDFWARQARLAYLHMDLMEKDPNALANARELFAIAGLRDDVRILIGNTSRHFFARGFFEHSLALSEFLLGLEDDELSYAIGALQSEEQMHWAHRPSHAKDLLQKVLASPALSTQLRHSVLHDLGYSCMILGEFDKADECYAQLAKATRNRDLHAKCDIASSFILRGRNKMDEAVQKLDQVPQRYPDLALMCAYAKLESALVLCSLKQIDSARKALEDARTLCPGYFGLRPGMQSTYTYPVEMIEGNFGAAAQLLLDDSRADDSMLYLHAEQATKAAMLLEIHGEKRAADKIWTEIMRRFPQDRCAFFAGFAEGMLHDKLEMIEQIVTGAFQYSELLLLAAMTFAKRGDRERACDFYEKCLKEDPSGRWPAYLAAKKLCRERQSA